MLLATGGEAAAAGSGSTSSSAMESHIMQLADTSQEMPSVAVLQAHDQAAQTCATAAALMRLGEPLVQAVHDAELVLHASESVDADCAVTSTSRPAKGAGLPAASPPVPPLATCPLSSPPLEAMKEAVLASIQPASIPLQPGTTREQGLQPSLDSDVYPPISSNASLAGSAVPPTIDPAEFEGLGSSPGIAPQHTGGDDSEVEVSPSSFVLRGRPDDAPLLAGMVHGLTPPAAADAGAARQASAGGDAGQAHLVHMAAHVLGISGADPGSMMKPGATSACTLDDPLVDPSSQGVLQERVEEGRAVHAPAQMIGGTGLGAHSGGHLPDAQDRSGLATPTPTPAPTPATASPGHLTPVSSSTQPAFKYMLSLDAHINRLRSRTPGRARTPSTDAAMSPAAGTPTHPATHQPLLQPSTSLNSALGSAPPSVSSGLRRPPTPVPGRRLSMTSSCSVRSQASSSVASSMHSARMSHTSLDELAAVEEEGASCTTSHSSLASAPSQQLPEWYSPCGSPSHELDLYPLPLPEEAEQQLLVGPRHTGGSPAAGLAVDQRMGVEDGRQVGISPGLHTPAPSMQADAAGGELAGFVVEEADVQGTLLYHAGSASTGVHQGVEAPPVTTATSAMIRTESEARRRSTDNVLSGAAQQLAAEACAEKLLQAGGNTPAGLGQPPATTMPPPPVKPAAAAAHKEAGISGPSHTGVPQLDAQPALVLALQEQMALHGCVGRAAAMAGALVHAGLPTAKAANIAEAAMDPADVVDFTDARTNLTKPDTVPDMQAAGAAGFHLSPARDAKGPAAEQQHTTMHEVDKLSQLQEPSPFSLAPGPGPVCLPAPTSTRTPTSTPTRQPSAGAQAGEVGVRPGEAAGPREMDDSAVVEALQGLPVREVAHGGTAAGLALSRLSEEEHSGDAAEQEPRGVMQALLDEVYGQDAAAAAGAGETELMSAAERAVEECHEDASNPCTPTPSFMDPPCINVDEDTSRPHLVADELQDLGACVHQAVPPQTLASDGLPALPSRLASSLGGVTPSASFMLPSSFEAPVSRKTSGAGPAAATAEEPAEELAAALQQ